MSGNLRFDGRVAVVTGAGGGLGRAYALMFGERGAKVVVNDLGGSMKGDGQDSRAADKVVQEIRAKGGEAVANYDSVENGEAVIKTALDTYGRIDILVNNAGILRDRSFARTSDLDWDLIHRVHLRGSFMCSRAAWEHMKKNNYGRIIMTTSAAGLYGNFGQANYSAAKMGLVGLGNTLAIEGKKYNIGVNTIAPIAGSRLTETVMPADVVGALKPEFVGPVVLWLCHETCSDTGGIFEVGGGYAAKVQLMKSKGKVVNSLRHGMTPEMVRDNWQAICDFTEFDTPRTTAESSGKAYEALSEAADQDVQPNKTAAQTPEAAIGRDLADAKFSYTERDSILYALGVGYSTEHKDFLKFLFEMNEDFCTLPTYGAIIGQTGLSGLVGGNLPVTIDPTQLLHGEQYLEILKPIPTSGKLINKGRVSDVLDKGKGVVFIMDVDSYDESGEKVLRNQSSVYVRGMGGYNGKRKSNVHIEPQDHPNRPPDASIREKTSVDQAAIYRLSGDYNPLHIDPSFAAMGGFDKPILHGLCSFGYSGKHVLSQYCDNDPKKFKAIKVRFTKPVMPGETLQTDMWKEGSRVYFQTSVVENGNVCLSGAYVDLVDSASAETGESAEDKDFLQTDVIFQEIGNELKNRQHLVKKINAILCFKITKDGKIVREWTLDLKNPPGAVYNGMPRGKDKPSVTITVSDSDFLDIAGGQQNAQQAFFAGKLKVTGNIMLGPKLETIFKDELSKL